MCVVQERNKCRHIPSLTCEAEKAPADYTAGVETQQSYLMSDDGRGWLPMK